MLTETGQIRERLNMVDSGAACRAWPCKMKPGSPQGGTFWAAKGAPAEPQGTTGEIPAGAFFKE